MKQVYYFDVDGVLADFHGVYNPKARWQSLTYDFIRSLKPFTANISTVKTLIAQGATVYINTMVANATTEKARRDWLAEYLPEIKPENIITVVGHGNKADYIREPGVLIDDKLDNCKRWEKAGYKAIWLEEKGGPITL